MTALIIDDDAEDTALFCEAFYELFPQETCHVANSCEEIKDTLDKSTPDIIFIDGHFFPVSARDCLRKLHELTDRNHVKIVLHSGSLSPADLKDFSAIGVDDVLIKPSSFTELKSNLVSVIVDKFNLAARPLAGI
jgi:DNA-binding response OmpR family regulator